MEAEGELTLHEKLVDIQQNLKVPKAQKNDFAGFQYRNLEDIEDKVKPLLKDHNLSLMLNDEMVEIGGRVYVKATATLTDGTDGLSVSAYAREAETKKGMDDAQITGAASSYARKYAASGLFLIDNTKDADSQDNSKPAPKVQEQKVSGAVRDTQLKQIHEILSQKGVAADKEASLISALLEGKKVRDLTFTEALKFIVDLREVSSQTLINMSNGEPF